jgi:hypothetical protein
VIPLILTLLAALVPVPAPACWDSAWRCRDVLEVRGSTLDQAGWLQKQAKAWAVDMAARRTLSHAPLPGWGPYGENVGYGPDWATVMAAFVQSPHHLANIRDTDFTQVGIGTAHADGLIYVVIRFH